MSLLGASSKDYPVYDDPDKALLQTETSLAKIVSQIPPSSTVLDVGCASGYLAQLLRGKNCIVTGIEVNESAAAIARQHSAEVFVADLEEESLAEIVKRQEFDIIVFADVLEHLRTPGEVLKSAHGLLKPGGVVLASVPNIAHGAMRLSLLTGNFDYAEFGILDDSHLRFFTARSLDALFLSAGFSIEHVDRFRVPLFSDSNLVPHIQEADFAPQVVEEVRSDPEHDTLQFIVRALPLTEAARASELEKRFLSASTELAQVAATLRRRESEMALANSRNAEIESRFAGASAELTELSAEAAIANARIAELEKRLADASPKTGKDDGRAAARIAELEGQLAQTSAALNDAFAVLRDGRDEMVKVQAASQELEKQYASTRLALQNANEEMLKAQAALLDQTEAFLEATRAENERLALLIDTVQSSHFWKVKRVLGRFRRALLR
ncbi:MAG TPA: methyltransferase domain-containing protein [Candidatus Rubrimentiphilum sp.]|nr:methyltransferase domain-containing protein [Candidatus Rubrimentiphilum sp.]